MFGAQSETSSCFYLFSADVWRHREFPVRKEKKKKPLMNKVSRARCQLQDSAAPDRLSTRIENISRY